MNSVNGHKVGLTFAIFSGAMHLIWTLLVAVGAGQPMIDWITRIHFVEATSVVTPFKVGSALALIVFTSAVGYLNGRALAGIWNTLGAMRRARAA